MEITFNTAHGRFNIETNSLKTTIIDICRTNNLPFQSLTFYGKYENGEEWIPLTGIIDKKISEYIDEGCKQIIFQPNRNINFAKILLKDFVIEKCENASTEYAFQTEDFNKIVNKEFTPKKCFDYINRRVNSFLNNIEIDKRKIVVGVSGGGDSNTLLKALISSNQIDPKQIIAVMCTGLDVWDTAIERANHICNEVNVDLNVVDSNEICEIIGKKNSENWDEAFFEVFEDSDIDALGTLIVRRVLQHYVKKYKAQAMITGLNLEDLLAESFFQITKSKLPLPFPIRVIDGISLWYPLYEVPKKILDGCYPKFSLENYQQRNADKLINRAIPYFFSQMTASILPGFEFDLLKGFEKLSNLNTDPFHYEEELGFSVTEPLPKELIGKWKYYTIC